MENPTTASIILFTRSWTQFNYTIVLLRQSAEKWKKSKLKYVKGQLINEEILQQKAIAIVNYQATVYLPIISEKHQSNLKFDMKNSPSDSQNG